MTKVVLPAFAGEEYQSFEMRQLVSALELRFQALEDATQAGAIPSVEDTTGAYAPIDHTHLEADITNLQDYLLNLNGESLLDLGDVVGTPTPGNTLVFDGVQWVAQDASASYILSDLGDVDDALNPVDGEVLTYSSATNEWIAAPGTAASTLAGLTDTDLTGQFQYDLLFNATGAQWQDTAGELQWNPTLNHLQLAYDHSINWKDSLGASVVMIVVEDDGGNDTLKLGNASYPTDVQGTVVNINGTPYDPNATHTGEVTGATALTVDVTSITNKIDIGTECDPADDLAIHDDSVGDLKKLNVSVITDGGYF